MTTKYTRRYLLAGVAGLTGLALVRWPNPASAVTTENFEVQKPEEEWRKILTKQQYEVLRKHGTERPVSSPLNQEKRKGTFACAGCDLPLFSSETKFESGTGWPSFWQPLPNAVGTIDRPSLAAWRAPRCIAAAAAAISATSSTTARSRPACATA